MKINIKKVNKTKLEPVVIFKNEDLQHIIGNWLGVITKPLATKKQLDNTSKEFSLLLRKLGIDKQEVCMLEQIDNNLTIKCSLVNAHEDVIINLTWREIFKDATITINFKNSSKEYIYRESTNRKPAQVILSKDTMTNDLGNSLTHYLNENRVSYILKNGDYVFSFNILKPQNDSKTGMYHIPNEAGLEEYLLNLKFPIDIVEVYKKIRQMSFGSVMEYPSFTLEVKKAVDNIYTITDLINLKYGENKGFIITKDDKTVGIDSNNRDIYKIPRLSIIKERDKIQYNLQLDALSDLTQLPSPIEQLKQSEEELKRVRTLETEVMNYEIPKK